MQLEESEAASAVCSTGNPTTETTLTLDDGANTTPALTFFQVRSVNACHSAAFDLAGQFGHSEGGVGGSYRVTLTRFLMQRCTTGGEYTDATFHVNGSAFIECPNESGQLEDGDNDGLYIVNGTHGFTNSLWGWTKDDGVDSGASGAGVLNFDGCWFESIFH